MKGFIFALVLLGVFATTARAQDAIPDLKGTWSGKGKAIVFGNNLHHPGSQTVTDPRGCTSSAAPKSRERRELGRQAARPPRSPGAFALFHPGNIIGEIQNLIVADRRHGLRHRGIIAMAGIIVVARSASIR